MYPSVATRKHEEAARRAGLVEEIAARLRPYARKRGGRYILFGSLARGDARFDSDVDLIIDFPAEWESEAWRTAEDLCAELRIEVDMRPLGWCAPEFVARIMPDARVIG